MTNIEKKGIIIGALVGLVLFIVIGFLPSAYTGGLIGLKLIYLIFGADIIHSGIGSRIVLAFLMIISVVLSGSIFIIGCGTIGWIVGILLKRKKLREKRSVT
ncbi:MAG: hypothetical protein ACK40E_04955 [Caldimicrobium sp.]